MPARKRRFPFPSPRPVLLAATLVAPALVIGTGETGVAGTANPVGAVTAATPAGANGARPDRDAARRLARQRRVYVVGDSLTVGSAASIRGTLRGRVASVEIDAAISRFTPTGVRLLRTRPAAHATVWVVALGTNDAPDPSGMRSAVRQVLRRAGRGRKVLWVNVVRPGGYERVNRELAVLDSRVENLTVLDWARVVRRHRGWLNRDGVHLTSAGYRARGIMIAKTAAELAGQL